MYNQFNPQYPPLYPPKLDMVSPQFNNPIQTNDGFTPLYNGMAVKFSKTEDIFFIKSFDEFGNPTQKKYSFTEIVEVPPNSNFVTKDEMNKMFEELKGAILDGKQSISKSKSIKSDKDVD